MNKPTTTAGAVALRSWLSDNEMSAAAFATANKLNARSVQHWLSGAFAPRMDKAGVVERATGGYVAVRLWTMKG